LGAGFCLIPQKRQIMQKNILIVGGSSGIGRALAESLSGHQVHVWSRTSKDLEHLSHVQWQEVDMRNVSQLPEISGPLDGVVYAPGTILLKPFRGLKEADFMDDWQVNFMGAVKVLQHAEASLKQSTHASVVLFSTVAVQTGMPFHASIASAKGAVEGLVRSLAAEWAPKIRVNAIAPSLTATPLAERLLRDEEKVKAAGARHPLQRISGPAELAHLAQFLLGENASGFTGQIFHPDNGMSALKI
jgi:3-oxoacyl-[acyl-carrier protein] reductase